METSTRNLLIFLCLLKSILTVTSLYTIPELEIEALSPKGIQVTLPNSPGNALFAFHGNINTPITKIESGEIAGTVEKEERGKWIYRDDSVQLKPGDTVYYWIFVQNYALGFTTSGEHKIKGAVTQPDIGTTPAPCETQHNDSTVCQNMVVNLTQSVFILEDELASVQETNTILKELIQKDPKLSQSLVLTGVDSNVRDYVMIVTGIIRDKLNLQFGVKNIIRMADGRVEFQVRDIDEKVQILKVAKTRLKNSRYSLT